MDLDFKNKKASFSAGFFVVDLQREYGRNGGIWTHDPYTPSIVRYLTALRSDIFLTDAKS